MQKALLFTLLGATMVIPLLAARGGSVKSAVRRSVIATVVFCVFYWLALVFIYPTLPSSTANAQQTTQQ